METLSKVTEQLNQTQAEFEYRRKFEHEQLHSPRTRNNVDAKILQDIGQGHMPARVGRLMAADMEALERVRAKRADDILGGGKIEAVSLGGTGAICPVL
jgi:hypothetical protein